MLVADDPGGHFPIGTLGNVMFRSIALSVYYPVKLITFANIEMESHRNNTTGLSYFKGSL